MEFVTATATTPSVCAGVVAEMVCGSTTVKAAALTPSNVTAVAPVNPLPVMVTLAPPAGAPPDGLTLATVGFCTNAHDDPMLPRSSGPPMNAVLPWEDSATAMPNCTLPFHLSFGTSLSPCCAQAPL